MNKNVLKPTHSTSSKNINQQGEDKSKIKGPSGKERKKQKEKKKADNNDITGFNGSNVLSIKGYCNTKKHGT